MLKFGLVGLLGMTIDFSVTYLLKEKILINQYFANAVGFSCAVISNFLLNTYWTFKSAGEHRLVVNKFFYFVAISVTGLCLNSLIIFLLTSEININFYLAKLIAVGVVFFWNFLMNNYVTYRREHPQIFKE